jgi:hypothetical protein
MKSDFHEQDFPLSSFSHQLSVATAHTAYENAHRFLSYSRWNTVFDITCDIGTYITLVDPGLGFSFSPFTAREETGATPESVWK